MSKASRKCKLHYADYLMFAIRRANTSNNSAILHFTDEACRAHKSFREVFDDLTEEEQTELVQWTREVAKTSFDELASMFPESQLNAYHAKIAGVGK